jgi:hypothetical protein
MIVCEKNPHRARCLLLLTRTNPLRSSAADVHGLQKPAIYYNIAQNR